MTFVERLEDRLLSNPRADRVRDVAALTRRSMRSKRGLFRAEGPQNVRRQMAHMVIVDTELGRAWSLVTIAGAALTVLTFAVRRAYGAKHEILQEQDRYRAQFWAAFDAFVPGTPLFK